MTVTLLDLALKLKNAYKVIAPANMAQIPAEMIDCGPFRL